jgi:hypothetical protein
LVLEPDKAMFQPRAKLEFVRRYCSPRNGWLVCVDIDPSEEGRTGGKRESAASQHRQEAMLADAPRVRDAFKALKVGMGQRKHWCQSYALPYLEGDPDITAYDPHSKRCIVAEVEGASSGQPEQKLYKAIGQMVRIASNIPSGWHGTLVLVVYGVKIAEHLRRSQALAKLGIGG